MGQGFRDRYSLGWEVEAIRAAHSTPDGVLVGRDGSVGGDGLEYKIEPALVRDPEAAFKALRKLLGDPGLATDVSCGFHVHLGLKLREDAEKLRAWAAWCVTLARETEQYVFSAVPKSRRNNRYCQKWDDMGDSAALMDRRWHPSKSGNGCRYAWLNPVEAFRPTGIRTVEFRLMGETKQLSYLMAWTAFCVKFGELAWRLMDDASFLRRATHEVADLTSTLRGYYLGTVASSRDKVFVARKMALETKLLPTDHSKGTRGVEQAEQNIRTFTHQECYRTVERVRGPDGRFVGRVPQTVPGCNCSDCQTYNEQRLALQEGREMRQPQEYRTPGVDSAADWLSRMVQPVSGVEL